MLVKPQLLYIVLVKNKRWSPASGHYVLLCHVHFDIIFGRLKSLLIFTTEYDSLTGRSLPPSPSLSLALPLSFPLSFSSAKRGKSSPSLMPQHQQAYMCVGLMACYRQRFPECSQTAPTPCWAGTHRYRHVYTHIDTCTSTCTCMCAD